MNITPETKVGDLVVENPVLARLFEKIGIDYCCGGKATLAEACRRTTLSLDALLELIQQGSQSPSSEEESAISQMDVLALLDHIERKHHTFTREELERAERLMTKVLHAHSDRHPELRELAQLLEELTQELAVHMQKEERILFPYLRALAAAQKASLPLGRPAFQSALNPIRVMHQEHDAAGLYLQRLRELTGDFLPPADACPTFRALYESLAALRADLHQHIHLENNVLFPRAVPLEQRVFGQS